MKLKELTPNPANPRKISDEKLAMLRQSLEKFGDLSGFVFNEGSKTLVGGHQRGRVLPPEAEVCIQERFDPPTKQGTTALGYVVVDGEKFSYRQVRWDATTEKAANIAANAHSGEWDLPKLSDWLTELDKLNFEMPLTGFTAKEIEDIVAPFHSPNFAPGTEMEQGRLDEKKPIACPNCGHEFVAS